MMIQLATSARAATLKPLTMAINTAPAKASVFGTATHFYPSLLFLSSLRAYLPKRGSTWVGFGLNPK